MKKYKLNYKYNFKKWKIRERRKIIQKTRIMVKQSTNTILKNGELKYNNNSDGLE